MGKNRAVFLDRDGCVNVEDSHIRNIGQFRLYPDSIDSIRRLKAGGFMVVVITNQSGVARGYMTEERVQEIHALLRRWLADEGVEIDGIEYCPHHPEGAVGKYAVDCDCRKPKPGMVLRAAQRLDIDLASSYVIGDKISDIALGPVTGAKSILVRTGFGERSAEAIEKGAAPAPDFIADGIGQAVEWTLADAGLRAGGEIG